MRKLIPLTLNDLLSKGYFPVELPTPFNSSNFAYFVVNNLADFKKIFRDNKIAEAGLLKYNLARSGTLRRQLSIVNPNHFTQLSIEIVDNWKKIAGKYEQSNFSKSRPTIRKDSVRAICQLKDQKELIKERAKLRVGSRFILKTDISMFYSSIYTHSIPWAYHDKIFAKRNRYNDSLLGNKLDKLVRFSQNGQTIGIPIGPDTSFAIAELILNSIDIQLRKLKNIKGMRYVDDFEFYTTSLNEAEKILAELMGILDEYELSLNPKKTTIIELPYPLEMPWISELRLFKFSERGKSIKYQLYQYFDKAIELCRQYPEENVLQYAISRLSGIQFSKSDFKIIQDYYLQFAIVRPGILPYIIEQLLKYYEVGYDLSYRDIKNTFHSIIYLLIFPGFNGQ